MFLDIGKVKKDPLVRSEVATPGFAMGRSHRVDHCLRKRIGVVHLNRGSWSDANSLPWEMSAMDTHF